MRANIKPLTFRIWQKPELCKESFYQPNLSEANASLFFVLTFNYGKRI